MADKLRVVLAGCGGITGAWLGSETTKREVEIVGMVDIRAEAAERCRERNGLAKDVPVGTDLAEMIRRTKPVAVFDCTIPEAHAQVTITALEHGCHVLGEKPMADTMDNARRMVAAADKARKIYAVTQTRRYDPNLRRLRRFLDSGAIGQVHTVHSDFFIAAHFGGFRERMKHVLLVDMAIHSFDQGRVVCGADPRAVSCLEWNPPGSWYQHDASAVATFEMTRDIVYTYRGCWAATGMQTSWECDWRIFGTLGAVRWDGGGDIRCQVLEDPKQPSAEQGGGLGRKLRDVAVPQYPDIDPRRGHDGAIADFVACVRDGGRPETIYADNINSLAMVLGAVDAAEQGRRVEIRV